ncbi:ATP-binding cassette domain-containing protein [Gordonia sp. CPCC 205333]|uniref:ATP-binding cassette domain-containing protein n=1 Tax=Gordonia sp. CPCC 205333 TaxID=3140790 RepID=UPI003AF33566
MTLSVRDLSVQIPLPNGGVVDAVTRVSLVAQPSRIHYLVGGSGSGKSTLLDAITGLLPADAIISGQIATDETGCGLGHTIGVVPQSPATSFTPVRRLGSQLSEAVKCLGGKRTPEELLAMVDLDAHALRRYPHELSGGMAQRAAIAAALAGNPPILLADEPTASLDAQRSLEVLTMLTTLAATGRVVVVATHDIAAVRAATVGGNADVSVMFASRVVESGPMRRVLTTPEHSYTGELLAASEYRFGAAR